MRWDHRRGKWLMTDTNRSLRQGKTAQLLSVRVRIFRKSDSEAVRRLFTTCMMIGEGAPARAHLAATTRSPSFLCAFALLIISITVEVTTLSSFLPAYLDVTVAAIALLVLLYLCYSIYSAVGFYIQFGLTCLRTDLKNIQGHYNLCQVTSTSNENSEDPELEATSMKGFWVAEIVSPVTNKAEIVGCISLGDPPPPPFISGPGTTELRRMIVSPYHRRRGIARALIEACEAHATTSKHKLTAIVLRTTFYQPHARQLYTKLGKDLLNSK
ncbi:acetyltransferase protein [Lentinula edodes]|uniref:Probable N-acetyltransferase 14 n=1 Tax=Lentinula edodes TaxID=5353 RepID=A0A1Q3EHX9_LENED|nr:acetyltransferase protein [Lentinula edodes]